jgi:DNA-binding transcriptional LysR family regulator
MPFAVVHPPGHALEQLERVAWADLAAHPLIALQGQFTERLLRDMDAALREQSLAPHHEVTFMTTALAMAGAGLGITVCLPYAAPMVALYGLRMRLLEEPRLTRRFFIHARVGRQPSPAAASFAAFLHQFVAGI